ncbi:MAG: hypothetical protein JW995_13850 [Melioribacteraceae bacterium]|nr:hypothetical protein [Melioribacteraceae bacterium]
MKKFLILFFTASVLFYSGCGDVGTDPVEEEKNRGDIVSVNSNAILNAFTIKSLLFFYDQNASSDFQPLYDVEIVSIVYRTIDWQGNLVDASGAIVIPRTSGNFPLISLHHGTQTNSTHVGSQNIMYAMEGIIAASLGYVASQPDYLGFGISELFHPYLHEETSASSAIDMLRATRNYCEDNSIELNDQLFLAGYSQGGYVTMAAHKEIEAKYSDEFSVTASAPMAGPHSLLGTALQIISGPVYERPSFISFLIMAYNEVYGWNKLSEIFNEPYDDLLPQLFDGTNNTWEIDAQLPVQLDILFKDSFLTGLKNGYTEYLINALLENSVLDWTPQAPIAIIHGDADTFVPFDNATAARDALLANGASFVDLIPIPGGDHITSLLPSIEYTINWFNTFRSGSLSKVELAVK